ncbi:prenyltransferase [Actinoallomurus rhizosphaericola]|uniref:prenyltransferase n=1 Tax=Actinoallomurus rhizosphaericola TaxID=2952536 RepID=UPI0020916C05|nr:prenyltransferase [Actinoallomurus rhizosphaericola]MCO5991823.1 prenyltransferase [Actinoallomurus rhizosphaericola]
MRRPEAVPGILTADDILATARSIAAQQEPSGAIPWFAPTGGVPGHVDAWNHVEAAMALSIAGLRAESRRAYEWLRANQREDGSWPAKWVLGEVTEPGGESNHAAYIAVGVWHELLLTGDQEFAERMWPAVRRAIEFALGLQTARGEIIWIRHPDGSPDDHALLTGCSSIHQSLRCAVALAERLGEPQPDWELAADQLGHVVAAHPEAFADKSRFSMDWYYPVLGGPLRGPAAYRRIDEGWETFVADGLGCRCVSDQPWVTGAESCELVLALDAMGDTARARALFATIQHLRHEDGSYWTGWQFANRRHFPGDRSTYTAAAVILAADALADASPAARLFKEIDGRPLGPSEPADPVACGCESLAEALS